MSHACHSFWKCYKALTFCSLLTRCTIPCACHAKRHLHIKKWSGAGVFCTFWLRNVLRATTACTSISKSGPNLVCFVHFDFEICFAPQRRALFRHRNFEKCSEHEVFLPFSLANVLRSTTACISHLASWLCTRCFSEPTFRPSRGANHWKHTVFRDFPTFSRTWIFFLLRLFAHLDLLSSETFSFFFSSLLFSSLTLPISAFHLPILSEVWLLNFPR